MRKRLLIGPLVLSLLILTGCTSVQHSEAFASICNSIDEVAGFRVPSTVELQATRNEVQSFSQSEYQAAFDLAHSSPYFVASQAASSSLSDVTNQSADLLENENSLKAVVANLSKVSSDDSQLYFTYLVARDYMTEGASVRAFQAWYANNSAFIDAVAKAAVYCTQ